jgi:serine/threonine-protein kinase
MTLVGQVFSSRYEIEREVAQGGMAEVYLARDQLLSRPVALKALFPEYAREPSFVERFRREAQAAANLNHPNIVAIYDWGQESGTYFIVMEYVEGRSLRDLIRSEAPLEPNLVAEIGGEIASALAFAHRSGVVHRDVKPGNVLLTRAGTVKVTDFGIARAGTSDGLTQTGSVMGTATYFAPEQAQGLPVDGRSDVYSLGVVLYEMVTGVAPFTGDSPVAVAYKHVREDPVTPSHRNPDVPPDLERIIMTALAKDPSHRYQTADDLRADLLRFRRGRPIAAAPVTAIVAEVPTTATTAHAAEAYAATKATPRVEEGLRHGGAPGYERRRPNPALVTFLTLLALTAVIGAILFIAIRLGGSEAQVTVPNVIGKNVTEAEREIRDARLRPEIRRVPDARPVDTVIDQDPRSGKARRNSTVTLTVSDGAKKVTIPLDIKGKLAAEASAQLETLKFEVKTRDQASVDVERGRVIDSIPPAGSEAGEGSVVTLLVSTGPEPTAIPDVKGQSQDQALQTLTLAGFTRVTPLGEPSDTTPQGAATRTDPKAGEEVAPDTPIKLYISTGKPTVTIPLVKGLTLAAARTQLEGLGFVVTTLEQQTTSGNVGKVLDQTPSAGMAAEPGSTVVLTVGVATPVTTTATTTTSTTTTTAP